MLRILALALAIPAALQAQVSYDVSFPVGDCGPGTEDRKGAADRLSVLGPRSVMASAS